MQHRSINSPRPLQFEVRVSVNIATSMPAELERAKKRPHQFQLFVLKSVKIKPGQEIRLFPGHSGRF